MLTDMTPQQASQKLKTNPAIRLIDVREAEEYKNGHIAGSMNIALNELYRRTGLPSDKNTEIFVCCQSGTRSARAKEALLQMGYTRVFNIGSVRNWPLQKG